MKKRNFSPTQRRWIDLKIKATSALKASQKNEHDVQQKAIALKAAEQQLEELAQHLKAAIDEKESQITKTHQLQQALSVTQSDTLCLIQKMDESKVTQEQCQKVIEEQEEEIATLKMHEFDTDALAESRSLVSQQQSTIDTLNNHLASREKECVALEQEKQDLLNAFDEAKATIKQLEHAQNNLPTENLYLKNQCTQITHDLEQKTQETSLLRENLTSTTAQNVKLKNDNQKLMRALNGLKELTHWLKSVSWHNYKEFAQQKPSTVKIIEAAIKPDYLSSIKPKEGFSLASFREKLPSFWQKKSETPTGLPRQPSPTPLSLNNNPPRQPLL